MHERQLNSVGPLHLKHVIWQACNNKYKYTSFSLWIAC